MAKANGKCALVLEGGSFRGQFTAGVLDVLLEQGVTFDACWGVSAGAPSCVRMRATFPSRNQMRISITPSSSVLRNVHTSSSSLMSRSTGSPKMSFTSFTLMPLSMLPIWRGVNPSKTVMLQASNTTVRAKAVVSNRFFMLLRCLMGCYFAKVKKYFQTAKANAAFSPLCNLIKCEM